MPSSKKQKRGDKARQPASLQDVKVLIEVLGRHIEQFPSTELGQVDDNSRQIRYIEAVDNADFAVLVALPSNHEQTNPFSVAAKLVIDGRDIVTRELTQKPCSSIRIEDKDFENPRTQFWQRAPFKFLPLSSDHSIVKKTSNEDTTKLGTIQVVLQECDEIAQHGKKMPDGGIPAKRSVPKKVLRSQGITSSISKGDAINIETPESVKSCRPTSNKKNLVELRYRSKTTLQRMGYIPRDPSPNHEVELQDAKTEAARQMEIAREIARMEAQLAELKRASSGRIKQEPGTGPEIKVETPSSSSRKRKHKEGALDKNSCSLVPKIEETETAYLK